MQRGRRRSCSSVDMDGVIDRVSSNVALRPVSSALVADANQKLPIGVLLQRAVTIPVPTRSREWFSLSAQAATLHARSSTSSLPPNRASHSLKDCKAAAQEPSLVGELEQRSKRSSQGNRSAASSIMESCSRSRHKAANFMLNEQGACSAAAFGIRKSKSIACLLLPTVTTTMEGGWGEGLGRSRARRGRKGSICCNSLPFSCVKSKRTGST